MKAKPALMYVICFLVANHPKMCYLKTGAIYLFMIYWSTI